MEAMGGLLRDKREKELQCVIDGLFREEAADIITELTDLGVDMSDWQSAPPRKHGQSYFDQSEEEVA